MPGDTSHRGNNLLHRPFATLFRVAAVLFTVGLLLLLLFRFIAMHAGAGRGVAEPVPLGSLYPAADATAIVSTPEPSVRGQAAIHTDAVSQLRYVEDGRPAIRPRVALAKLYENSDVEEANRALLAVKPWKNSGSTHVLHPNGDYDFVETELITLLYLFGQRPDRLYPETVRHIVECLLIEEGSAPEPFAPRTLGFAPDTENHILMKEGARYLRNQWRFEHGTPEQLGNPVYDNSRNGLGKWLSKHLEELRDAGFFEFNSIPYLGYTVRALLNVEAFPRDPKIRSTARHILDSVNWQYALGSFDLRRCAPFRRQTRRAGITGLQEDKHTSFMLVWTNSPADAPALEPREETIAEVMPYRPPKGVIEWVLHKPENYFVRFGHGKESSPELYSGGPDFLVSAGGVSRGSRSMIAARPTSLFLHDGAKDLRDCFHLTGKGEWEEWNNTGVCDRLACSNGKVHVPEAYTAAATNGGWSVYNVPASPRLLIAVCNKPGIALLAVFPNETASAKDLAEEIACANGDEAGLARTFNWPGGGNVSYDLDAPHRQWVITAIDGKPTDRDFDRWPQMDGRGPKTAFDR